MAPVDVKPVRTPLICDAGFRVGAEEGLRLPPASCVRRTMVNATYT
jgi:hypothetical protein